MVKTYHGASKKKTDSGHVKSYLVESHLQGGQVALQELDALVQRVSPSLGKDNYRFSQLTDDTLFLIETWSSGQTRARIYVDTRVPRFWRFHTVDHSAKVDGPIEKLIRGTPKLDRVWLSEEFLLRMSHWGDFRGFKIEHERLLYPAQSDETAEKTSRRRPRKKFGTQLKLDSRSDLSQRLLDVIHEDEELSTFSSVAGLRLRYGDDEDEREEFEDASELSFCIDDIRYDGKFRTRGTDLQSHTNLLSSTARLYSKVVGRIEQSSIRNRGLSGDPFLIRFSEHGRLENVEGFCDYVFSAEDIFRLFGLPERLSKDAYRVVATDIHSGGDLQVDVYPTYLKFYLFEGSCGNSLLRFFSNLEKFHDARVTLHKHDGESFDFFDD